MAKSPQPTDPMPHTDEQRRALLQFDGKELGDPNGINFATGRKKEPLPDHRTAIQRRRK